MLSKVFEICAGFGCFLGWLLYFGKFRVFCISTFNVSMRRCYLV